jgi:hypothetical protein
MPGYDVSCTSASACTAVGDYGNGTAGMTLAERRSRQASRGQSVARA